MNIQELAELSLKKAVLIDFWAEWCGPCKTFGPILEKWSNKYSNEIHFEKVNVDDDPDMAAQFRVQSIPTIVLLSEGKIADISQGPMTEPQLDQWIKKHLPDLQLDDLELDWNEKLKSLPDIPSEIRTSQLEDWLGHQVEDKELQLEYLRAVSFSDPANAMDFLAQFKGANEHHWLVPYFEVLLNALNEVGENTDELEKNQRIAIQSIVEKNLEQAATHFIDLAAKGTINTNEGLKQFAVAFFSCLGDMHPLSKKYRKLFNMYLS